MLPKWFQRKFRCLSTPNSFYFMKKTIVLSFSIAGSSASDYFIRLSNRFAQEFKVVIVTDNIDKHSQLLNSDIQLHKWPSRRPTKFEDFRFLYRLLKAERPKLAISMFGSVNIFLICGWLLNIRNSVAWVRTLSTQFPQKRIMILRKRLVYKLSTLLIANSAATKNDLIDVYKVAPKKITVLPNAVPNYYSAIETSGIDNDLIVYIGRLHQSKGVDVLLKAFAQVIADFPLAKLLIVGNGPEKNNLENLVQDLKLDSVTFLDFVPKQQVLKFFKSAYCSVIPSTTEAFGFTVIEAMSMKTCVIGANNTGIKEIIVDGESGLQFETGNFADLSEKINRVFSDRNLRNSLAINGYKRFCDLYEVDFAVERDFQYFKKLL